MRTCVRLMLLSVLLSMSLNAAEPALVVKNLAAGKKQHIVTYGTSLTAGGAWVGQLRELLNKKFPGLATVTNSGQSGMWSKWGLDHLDERVIKKNPDTVLIEWAINDAFLEYKTSVEQAQKNLETMLDAILKHNPNCEIILMTMDPPINVHLEKRPEIEKYYQMYRDVAKARKLRLIDHEANWKPVLEKGKDAYLALVPDGIHPNAKGCEQIITPAIEAALFGK
jgi:acyl-CoA thioesterase-1